MTNKRDHFLAEFGDDETVNHVIDKNPYNYNVGIGATYNNSVSKDTLHRLVTFPDLHVAAKALKHNGISGEHLTSALKTFSHSYNMISQISEHPKADQEIDRVAKENGDDAARWVRSIPSKFSKKQLTNIRDSHPSESTRTGATNELIQRKKSDDEMGAILKELDA